MQKVESGRFSTSDGLIEFCDTIDQLNTNAINKKIEKYWSK